MAEGQEQDDKTEEPSERRIEKAIERGDVPRSADLAAWLSLAGAAAATFATGALWAGSIRNDLAAILSGAGVNAPEASVPLGLRAAALAAIAPLLAGLAGAIVGGVVMHRFVVSATPLMPKLDRISPLAGWKRIFAAANLVQFAKTILKVLIGALVLTMLWWADARRMTAAGLLADLEAVQRLVAALTSRLFWSLLALFAVFALADALYQRHAWRKRLRMSHQEVKEEHKETEGSPEVKQRLRSLQRQRARQRMMAAVPKASLVIANPTHFAVALRYEKGMAAPVCLAKGMDELALKIRAVAAEHRIPIVENPPLARALHATVKVDEEIPLEHYKAVAEVIGYVMRLGKKRR